eukprot:scaffold156990_cov31-Tisochrysis_lutea.AAC.4
MTRGRICLNDSVRLSRPYKAPERALPSLKDALERHSSASARNGTSNPARSAHSTKSMCSLHVSHMSSSLHAHA